MKLWDKGYKLDPVVEDFTVGNDFILDQRLVPYDCLGSIAHVNMLGKAGVLTEKEAAMLVNELNKIMELYNSGRFTIKKEQEDCHTAIEQYLTDKLGDTGRKIHTGRSRNDQVITALRLYCRDELNKFIVLMEKFIKSMSRFVKKYGKTGIPGYTHTRKAMPSSISMWGGLFIDSMKDNIVCIKNTINLINQSPSGSGAGYGIPFEIDRIFLSRELGFKKVQKNPLYVQHSRCKFEAEVVHSLSQVMFDLNKFSEDVIFFSMPEIGFFELEGSICTGSSIMPHKKNPDVFELLRAHYHTIISYEFQIRTIAGNLPSGYNRDFQMTKEPLINGMTLAKKCLVTAVYVIDMIKVNKTNCKKALTGEIYAAKRVYELVGQGVPFRKAYKTVAERFIAP